MGVEPVSEGQGQQAARAALVEALGKLTHRLQGRAEAARDFTRLTSRAQAISADAWQLQTSRWGFVENAGKLAADLLAFAQDVGAASARAAQEAEHNLAVVEALAVETGRLKALGPGSRQGDPDALEPLQATLEALRTRLGGAGGASDDAAMLAARAIDLAGCASLLKGGGREVEEVAAKISRALKAFSDAATSIATRLSNAPGPHGGAPAQAALRSLQAELAPYCRGEQPKAGVPGRSGVIGWL